MARSCINRRDFLKLAGAAPAGTACDELATTTDLLPTFAALAEVAREDLGDMGRPGKNQRPDAFVKDPKPWLMASKNPTSEASQ